MPFIPVDRGVRVSLIYDQDGQASQNSIWYYFGSGVPENLTAVAEVVYTNWAANVMPLLHADTKLVFASAQDFTTPDGGYGSFYGGTPVPGGLGGAAQANNVAFCMSFGTGHRGRSYRGRIYLPGISSGIMSSPNRVTDAWAGSITGAVYDALFGPPTTGGYPAVVSLRSGGAPRAHGLVTLITIVEPKDQVLDSMRRRLPGRGR